MPGYSFRDIFTLMVVLGFILIRLYLESVTLTLNPFKDFTIPPQFTDAKFSLAQFTFMSLLRRGAP
jgi:hypothetical protein